MGSLEIAFTLRQETGVVRACVEPNTDPRANGCDLLDSAILADAATGFPVCRAEVDSQARGYAATMGWIQFVSSSDSDTPGEYEIDPLSLFRDVDTPYAYFGIKPELFDAPFRERRNRITWRARSFLCASPDAVMSRVALPLCAFTWGFTIDKNGSDPRIAQLEALSVAAWADHLRLLEGAHPSWRFRSSAGDSL